MCSIQLIHRANAGKELGYADTTTGVIDGQHFNIHGKKEPYYTMMLMTTYGTLESSGNERKWRSNGETVRSKYPEIVRNHYICRHAVDDRKNRRQSPVSIEKTCTISYWPNPVFAFLLAVTEVNILLALTNIYGHKPMETLEF